MAQPDGQLQMGEPLDYVPVAEEIDFVVVRSRPEELVGIVFEHFTTQSELGMDLRLLGRMVGSSIADGLVQARSEALSLELFDGWTVPVEYDGRPAAAARRLGFLANTVNAFGWAEVRGSVEMNGVSEFEGLARESRVSVEDLRDAERMVGAVLEGATRGSAEAAVDRLRQERNRTGGNFNLIPSDQSGSCRQLLVTLCFDSDSFERRLNEAIKHAGIHCPNTEMVIFVTTKWEPKKWRSLERDVRALNAQFVAYFVGPVGRLQRIL
jgi:hypothetical protein